jgi:2-amino-4-hydroxy-6-hydroxymethyldihydropteridine diphosphokinase
MNERALVALGSNLGDRAAYLGSARVALASLSRTVLIAASAVEETVPFGPVAQGPYLNQMVALDSSLAPRELLSELLRIERGLGRVRRERWGARTIDLDLVRYGHHTTNTPELILPHPGIATRDFWQREIAELASIIGMAA